MAKEEKEEAPELVPEKKQKSNLKIIIIASSLIVVLALGITGALYFLKSTDTGKKAGPVAPRPLIGALWPMEPFIVNLMDNQGERYLKVVMQLEVSDQRAVAELEQLKPKLRDNVLDMLTAKTYGELMDLGGKQKLRDEVAVRLNAYLAKGKIVKVYFTDFVIQ